MLFKLHAIFKQSPPFDHPPVSSLVAMHIFNCKYLLLFYLCHSPSCAHPKQTHRISYIWTLPPLAGCAKVCLAQPGGDRGTRWRLYMVAERIRYSCTACIPSRARSTISHLHIICSVTRSLARLASVRLPCVSNIILLLCCECFFEARTYNDYYDDDGDDETRLGRVVRSFSLLDDRSYILITNGALARSNQTCLTTMIETTDELNIAAFV